MEYKKRLTRSTTDKWLAGVCGGIAEYFGWDVAILRIVYVVLTTCTAFCGVLVYILLWICNAEGNEVYRVRRQSKKTAEDSQKVILLVQR